MLSGLITRCRLFMRAGAALLLVTALPAGSAAADMPPKGVYFPETFTLDNGLQVVVVTNRRVPVITHMIWYKVGAADEPHGASGIAHFLEHLMFKGTDTVAAGEFSRLVARHGGRDNAFTSWDYTGYYQTVASDRLEMVMRLEADRMANLRLLDEEVKPERQVVLEERRQRTGNDPRDRLGEQVSATLFVHHPYGTPIIGWEPEIQKLDREKAEAFYRQWYAPNNAVLVVSGDVDAAQLKPLAEKYYGVIRPRPVPSRTRVEEPGLGAERRVILRHEEVRQPSLYRMYVAPSYHRGETRHAYPLQVLAEIMSGGNTSRLYKSLVVEQRIATGASLGYSPGFWDYGTLSVGVSPVPGVELAKAEEAMAAEIRKLLLQGVTEEEVETAKRRMLADAAYARDSLTGPAYAFGIALATGQTVDDVESWPQRIAAVTADQVNAAAHAVLDQPGPVIGVLLPAGDPKGS
ncbi:MAG TPA: pitrilysin family protein [Azospirillaceae bacterium]|nr:pitrilysin family protein [Azospirillaceae bacterium]